MRHAVLVVAGVLAILATIRPAPAGAITFGTADGNLHPNVGALVADWDADSPGPDLLCSGTLIDPQVFLTAAHCTAFLAAHGITLAGVTFDPAYDEDAASPGGVITGTYHTHPQFGTGGNDDPHDIAVVVLDTAASPTPAQLPTGGLLSTLKAQHTLGGETFTAVGYGTVRDTPTGGPHSLFFDGVRRYALQSFSSLQEAWLTLSEQPSTGNGGTCYGDSGGPHFLGGVYSNLIVSLTVTGDANCRSTDKTYRLDTASARAFLDDYVAVPVARASAAARKRRGARRGRIARRAR